MENCPHCNSLFEPDNVSIPDPLPDRVCFNCGTELTEVQIEELTENTPVTGN